jgi:hypothetical protein
MLRAPTEVKEPESENALQSRTGQPYRCKFNRSRQPSEHDPNDHMLGWARLGSALPKPRPVLSISAHWPISCRLELDTGFLRCARKTCSSSRVATR